MLSEHNFRLIFLCIYSCPQCIQNSSHNFPPFSRLPLINLIHRLLHISSLSCLVITLPPVPDSLIRPMLNKCGQKSFSHCLRTFFSLYLDHTLKLGTDHGACLSPTLNSPSDSWSVLSIHRTISMKLCTH